MLMVAPLIAGAALGAAGSMIGGALDRKAAKKGANKAYRRQKEFAKHAIQWKAEDARAAGLHPLFAMGAGTANYQPQFMAGQDSMGTALSDSAQQLGTAYAQSKAPPPGTPTGELGRAQLRAINASAQRDEAAAISDLSAAKRMEGAANTTQDGDLYSSSMRGAITEPNKVPAGRIMPKASEVVSAASADRARQAGKKPTWQRHQIGPRSDQWMDFPATDEGVFDEFGPAKAVATLVRYLQNRAKGAPLPKRRKRRNTRRRTRHNR